MNFDLKRSILKIKLETFRIASAAVLAEKILLLETLIDWSQWNYPTLLRKLSWAVVLDIFSLKSCGVQENLNHKDQELQIRRTQKKNFFHLYLNHDSFSLTNANLIQSLEFSIRKGNPLRGGTSFWSLCLKSILGVRGLILLDLISFLYFIRQVNPWIKLNNWCPQHGDHQRKRHKKLEKHINMACRHDYHFHLVSCSLLLLCEQWSYFWL